MDYTEIDAKWNKKWKDAKLHSFNKDNMDKKCYVLEMFSYPSGSNLHLGHWYNYGLTDSYARFKKMQGFEVFQPMGFDAFGLPAENFAIKTGIHPEDSTRKNIATMERQLQEMGAMFDWDHEVCTCDKDYYRWTQWLFLQLYKKGLAYQKLSPVNWCSSCNTVIANEQVLDGACERCGTTIIRKEMTQWFFKITAYAEELLSCLDSLDWPEKTKLMQKNWIGRSEGGEIEFSIKGGDSFKVFTTRADTICGVSYVVLAPEHPLVDSITTEKQKTDVQKYKAEAAKCSDIDRLSSAKEKTGVFTGAYCINPITKKEVPIWIADYCLSTYGTGAVMGVAAHDSRDFCFAKKYDLPIIRVIDAPSGEESCLPFEEDGVLTNSLNYTGLSSLNARNEILAVLEKDNMGGKKVNFRLRDWSVSRQRYWGAPIPVIHCEKCGTVPVPEKDLPVELPYNVNFTPDGKSPLGKCEEFMNVTCPECGGKARRDEDTLDTFVCSSWYFLRYPDNKNSEMPFNTDLINKMLPVDKYVGGAEHACMHLLYARFITKALRDMGYLNFSEPFTSLVHQGLILGADGNKMSKSKGNVVNPDPYIKQYGSDIFRLNLMFGFSYVEGGPWNDDGIKAVAKFLDRIERIADKVYENANKAKTLVRSKNEDELDYALNYCIKNVSKDLGIFSFNTAIARIMELVNAIYKYDTINPNYAYLKDIVITLLKILAPCTPHFAEELYERLGQRGFITETSFPVCDEKKLIRAEVEMVVQVNSKVRCKIVVPQGISDEELKTLALSNQNVLNAINGAEIKKTIVIPNRLINFAV